MPVKRILILGGTGEARRLAALLLTDGYDAVTSLAGVTQAPAMPPGAVRVGGFGGVEGLAHYLSSEHIAALADASHPYAAQIATHGVAAARSIGIPYLRLERPPWAKEHGDNWIEVANVMEAVAATPRAARILLAIGRKHVAPFLERADLSGILRSIEAPDAAIPPRWRLVLQRPPFAVADELKLIDAARLDHVVSKNAGGEATHGKIVAARERKIPVVMVKRPAKPDAPIFPSPAELVAALRLAIGT